MSKTDENLENAFAGESQANRKYLAFAKKADQEGYPQVAKLFRAAAAAETVHAHTHFEVMEGIKSTQDNLKAAIDGEGFEFKEMYPEYLQQAKDDGNNGAARSFGFANQVEKIHHGLYSKILEDLESGRTPEPKEYFVCQICGNTVENEAPDRCPICGAPKEKFLKIV